MKIRNALLLTGVLALTAAGYAGCHPGPDKPDPWGKEGDPLPAGATEMPAAQFIKMRDEGQFFLIQPPSSSNSAAEEADAKAAQALNKSVVEAMLASFPEREKLFHHEPSPTDSSIRMLADGNFRTRIRLQGGATQLVTTLGATSRYATIASALQNAGTRGTLYEIYRNLYERIPGSLGFKAGLPNAQTAANMSADELRGWLNQVYDHSDEIARNTPPAQAGGAEAGGGAGADNSGYYASCANHKAGGIYANYAFASKNSLPTVKNQGSRGSCVAFGVTSAYETAISAKFHETVNLSEQDMYNKMKLFWNGSPVAYGDGSDPGWVVSHMVSESYAQPYENQWSYNPSYSRGEDDDKKAYSNSCSGYTEYCSDSAHQGGFFCSIVDHLLYCGYATPAAQSAGSPYQLSRYSELWNHGKLDDTIKDLVSTLSSGTPVTIALSVTHDFDYADANGFSPYEDKDQTSRGGHLIHAVGAISNETLKTILPLAPPGAGGGYVMIKNSWGVCWADAGFSYLPYALLKRYAWSAIALTSVSK